MVIQEKSNRIEKHGPTCPGGLVWLLSGSLDGQEKPINPSQLHLGRVGGGGGGSWLV